MSNDVKKEIAGFNIDWRFEWCAHVESREDVLKTMEQVGALNDNLQEIITACKRLLETFKE